MSDPAADFERALDALAKPLEFLARRNFETLDRVRDLESTLTAATRRARQCARPQARPALDAIADRIPADDVPRAERVEQLREVLARVEAVRAGRSFAGPRDSERSAPPASEKPPPALDSPVQFIKGVGPRLAECFALRGVHTVEDLLRFLPRRYEDRRGMETIRGLAARVGETATVVGEILARGTPRSRGRRTLEVAIGDHSGKMQLKWFHVPGKGYAERFALGRKLRASGTIRLYRGQVQMVHPETELLGDDAASEPAEDRIVPIYPEVEGLRPARVRRLVEGALPAARALEDIIPLPLLAARGLPRLRQAMIGVHRPAPKTSIEDLHRAATPDFVRLIYEELFLVQLVVLRRKAMAASEPGLALGFPSPFPDVAAELFPFALTRAQDRVVRELEADIGRSVPMNRLLQGDVGSGKTAVAVTAAAAVARAGYQTAIMAPTELLAEQHARVALKTLTAAGIRVALLTGAATASERRETLAGLASGKIQVVVGTHALIQDDVAYAGLALAVVDEQHRFGVKQRARLVELGRAGLGRNPHMLVMTATPIPRTLALTVYGDLDLSLVDEMPPGRGPVETHLHRDRERAVVYERVRRAAEQGRQVYVVFPLVEGSDAEGLERVRDATSSAEELANGFLSGVRVGLLHGRMASDEKDRIMRRFLAGEIQVLVATTVIEVGIDVANATIMVIEHAERFGLSQLHQLRGRVGRGEHPGLCLLVARYTPSEDAWRRLKIMEKTTDGFRIAEEDLTIRGPGDFLGTRQSGVPLLSVANLARDQKVLQQAREDAAALLERDPKLDAPEHALLRARVDAAWEKLALAQIG